ncbi:MAG: CARDB domain-containing protein, partial [Eubacteriales bacterium]|nr:CARDB domain-containing protein [Eubacteriales bacterium]
MKNKLKYLSFILAVVILFSAFPFNVMAEDNATSGSGSTGSAGKDMGYYSNGQFMWKVSLYVGNYDHLTTASSLDSFYLVGNQSVYIIPDTCTAWSSAKYGAYNKVQYLNGYGLSLSTNQTFYNAINCPVPPVAYSSGNIDTVKAFFGNTSTIEKMLEEIATSKGTSPYGLVSGLSFTIGGVTKSGWSAEYLLPSSSMTNRVPWVVIYEPVVIGFLRDGSKVAFTATEYALAQINGWYNFCNRADNTALTPQYIQSLTRNVLPASVKLEESWFGYGTYNSYTNEIWSDLSVMYYGGWGMRFLPNVVEEKKYNYSVYQLTASDVIDGKTTINVAWMNKSSGYGWAECEIYLDGVRVVDDWIYLDTMTYKIKHYTDISVYGTGTKTITARINWSKRAEESNSTDNSKSITITSSEVKPDFAVTNITVSPDTVYQGNAATISVTAKNLITTKAYKNIPLQLSINGDIYKLVYANFGAGSSVTYHFPIVMDKLGNNTIVATINAKNMHKESNIKNNTFTSKATVNPYYEFSISGLSVDPVNCVSGSDITVQFRTDNWDTFNAYDDIPVELLYNGKILATQYVDYPAYGGNIHTFAVNVGNTVGNNTITARVNYGNRLNEVDGNNNTATTYNTVTTAIDLTITAVEPNAAYYQGTEVITT